MTERLERAAAALQERLKPGFDSSAKFVLEREGTISISDGSVVISDVDCDCTMHASFDTFKELLNGDLDPAVAFMSGKIRIEGSLGAAMKLSGLLL